MLSVVCPVYNEAGNIGPTLESLRSHVSIPMEVLVVYDHEDDTTIPAVKALGRFPLDIRLVRNQFGGGALNAIRTGFAQSKGEAILVIMADLSDDFSVIEKMYGLVNESGYDIVCGSRYMRGGRQVGGPRLKKMFSRGIGLSMHYLVGMPVHDVTNSFKMYRTEFLRSVEIESKGGFELSMELVVKAFLAGRKITEVPATWLDRTKGKSRFKMWKWAPNYLRWYVYSMRRFGQQRGKRN